MMRATVMLLYKAGAVLCLALALIGLVLPVMPTVPFLIVAAACASRGWPRLDAWLLSHHLWGPPIREWRDRRAIPRRAKYFALLGMAGSAALVQFLAVPVWLQYGLPVVLLAIAVWVWTRPES